MNNKLLSCEAKNGIETRNASYLLKFSYGPKFVKELPSHKVVKPYDYLVLNCEVDSNPASFITWERNGSMIYSYPTYTINSVTPEDYGTYTCIASLKDFPSVSSSVKILPPGKPIVEASNPQFAIFGRPGQVECLIEKEPKANEVIEWYQDHIKIDFQRDLRYKLRSEEIPRRGYRSILKIQQVLADNFRNYSCKASNFFGSVERTIELLPKPEDMDHVMPVIIIIIFFLIGVGAMGFLIYNQNFPKNRKAKNRKTNKTKVVKRSSSSLSSIRKLKRYTQSAKPSFILGNTNPIKGSMSPRSVLSNNSLSSSSCRRGRRNNNLNKAILKRLKMKSKSPNVQISRNSPNYYPPIIQQHQQQQQQHQQQQQQQQPQLHSNYPRYQFSYDDNVNKNRPYSPVQDQSEVNPYHFINGKVFNL
jgi:hypothetical protein